MYSRYMILIYYPILYIINNITTRCSRFTDCIIVLYHHYRCREVLYVYDDARV